MLKNWQFIDPKLAHKYKALNTQLNNLKQQRINIVNNKKLDLNTKNKMLLYNDQCIDSINTMLNKQKQIMTNYLDKQVIVLTKQQIHSTKTSSLSEQFYENTEKYQILKTKNKKNKQIDDTIDKNQTMSTFFNKTRVLNQSNDDCRNRSSQNLQTTYRNKTKSGNTQKQAQNTKYKKKASIHNKTIKRLKRRYKYYKNRSQFFQLTNNLIQATQQTTKQQLIEQNQTIKSLQNKVKQLEQQKLREKLLHQKQIQKMEYFYHKRISEIAEDYDKLSKMKQCNKYLQIKRKQLLSQLNHNIK